MVRWLTLAVIVIGISALAAWLVMPGASSESELIGGVLPGATPAAQGPQPRVVLDEPLTLDFGQMVQQKKGQHTWRIRNEGPGDLELLGGRPACSCTVLNLHQGEKLVVKTGESFDLGIEWETLLNNGAYEKSASIYTNDPAHPELTFRLKGTVRPVILTIPESGVLDVKTQVNTDLHTFNGALASPDKPDLKITRVTTTRPDFIEVTSEPLTADVAKALNVENGLHLQFTLKPTTKLGPFNEEVVILTNHPDRGEIRFAVTGVMTGPISLVPPIARVTSGVTTRTGGSTELKVWVQGQDHTAFQVARKPDKLKVTIEPDNDMDKSQSAAGKGRAYRLAITVPSGTPAGIIHGSIVLETDHPNAREVEVPVYILVQSEE